MLQVTRPTPSHFGIFVTDVERMVAFYKEVFGLTETDRGVGRTFKSPLVFLSASADQHHQLVIAGGRPAEATFSTVMQISFAVPDIQSLRDIRDRALALGASRLVPLNHGNALSVYFADPEGMCPASRLSTCPCVSSSRSHSSRAAPSPPRRRDWANA